MITTTELRREARCCLADRRGRRNWITLLGVCILLAGCTDSKLIIGPLYNRLDDRILSEFNKLGEFNEEQTAAFEAAVGTYHVWHRQAELPQYAALMQQVARSITEPGHTSKEDVRRWMETAEAHSRALRDCHPVNFLIPTIRSLTDDQISVIETRLQKERQDNRERHASRTPEERVEFRLKRFDKWASRINLELTASQRSALRTSLSRQISLRKQYHTLSDAWYKNFFTLAREQEAPDYDARMSAQLNKLWSLLESSYPQQWRANRQLWQETTASFEQSLSDEQRRGLSQWLNRMSATLLAISADEPSFKAGTDPTVGCLVDGSQN
jgi:hypothetical protein